MMSQFLSLINELQFKFIASKQIHVDNKDNTHQYQSRSICDVISYVIMTSCQLCFVTWCKRVMRVMSGLLKADFVSAVKGFHNELLY